MTKYIIMRADLFVPRFATEHSACQEPDCDIAGIARGKVYTSFEAAVHDAYLLDSINPIGWRVWDVWEPATIKGSSPLGCTRNIAGHMGRRDPLLPKPIDDNQTTKHKD